MLNKFMLYYVMLYNFLKKKLFLKKVSRRQQEHEKYPAYGKELKYANDFFLMPNFTALLPKRSQTLSGI